MPCHAFMFSKTGVVTRNIAGRLVEGTAVTGRRRWRNERPTNLQLFVRPVQSAAPSPAESPARAAVPGTTLCRDVQSAGYRRSKTAYAFVTGVR